MLIFWFLVLRVILFRRAKDPRTAEVLLLGLSARTDCEPTSSASQGQRSHLAHETSGGALAAVTTRDFPDPEGRSLTARLVATALFFLRQHIVHIFNILEHHGSCNDYYYISELHNKLAQATALARCPSGAYKSSLQNSSSKHTKQTKTVCRAHEKHDHQKRHNKAGTTPGATPSLPRRATPTPVRVICRVRTYLTKALFPPPRRWYSS